MAVALNGLARSTGGAAGAALFGAVVFALIPGMDRANVLHGAEVEVIVRAFHRAFIVAAAVAALAAYVASRMPDTALWERQAIS